MTSTSTDILHLARSLRLARRNTFSLLFIHERNNGVMLLRMSELIILARTSESFHCQNICDTLVYISVLTSSRMIYDDYYTSLITRRDIYT